MNSMHQTDKKWAYHCKITIFLHIWEIQITFTKKVGKISSKGKRSRKDQSGRRYQIKLDKGSYCHKTSISSFEIIFVTRYVTASSLNFLHLSSKSNFFLLCLQSSLNFLILKACLFSEWVRFS